MLRHVSSYSRGSPWARCLRHYATVTDVSRYPQPGDSLHGFTLSKIKHIPELDLTALQLQHTKTGAEYLHIAREDQNNVFAINFKTNPVDDTGLPHILEHVTLCGSEKYPVRDPFFKMMPRSLANFMNAFTSSDYTSYPFSTTNKQDFRNLSSVYLDATLQPLLKRSDFLQEGWRLGPEDPREAATRDNVLFKGVVYNEMKGQMSDASYLFYVRFRDHIFPSLHNAGGDPDAMTNLTYEQLVAYSRRNYHPSNAKLFSYGDLDLNDQLQFVDGVLQRFEKRSADRSIRMPRDLSQGPLKFTVPGPIDTMQSPDRQTKSSVTWLTCETSDIVETFSLSILSTLLMGGYGSPLYEGLIGGGLGSNFSPNTGHDTSGRVGIFSIGLDGMKSEDVPKLRDTVQSILRDKLDEAFLPHKVEGYMHQLELTLKHKTASFGMRILDKIVPGWFNGIDPMASLAWNEVIGAFRQRLSEKDYLKRLVEKYFQNNKCLVFAMEPDPSLNEVKEALEARRKEAILRELESQAESPEKAMEALGKQELDLLHEQENAKDSNIEALPSLHVQDISRQKEKKPVRKFQVGGVDSLWRETSTNGITYFQAKHVLEGLPDDLRLLLPLFTDALMRLGTRTKSVGDLEAEILLKTGGISVSPFSRPDLWSLDQYSEGLTFDAYALDRNVPAMLDLIHTLVLETDFASPKAIGAIQELLESKNSGALDSVAESGHHFAVASASAALSRRGLVRDQLSGLAQVDASARRLADARTNPASLQQLVDNLKLIQSFAISNSSSLSLRIVCEPSSVATNQTLVEKFLRTLPAASEIPPMSGQVPSSSLSRQTFFNLPFQVSYAGTCLQTAPYVSPDKAALTILGQLLTHNYLHPEVREKGGAYGASAAACPASGLFSMSSYRDPNPRNSLKTFQNAGQYARDKAWSARELEEGKLSVFQQIDAPMSVSNDGSKEFMLGITEEMEQKMREDLLDVTKEDVQSVAHKYLVDIQAERQATCVLGEKKAWVEEGEWQVKQLKMGDTEL
jgi:Zn-dependent M16 (insulinase) family peptidase